MNSVEAIFTLIQILFFEYILLYSETNQTISKQVSLIFS